VDIPKRPVVIDVCIPGVQSPPALGQGAATRPRFEQIFQEEAPYVGRTLHYLGVHEPHLEDACQEVFVVIHRQLGQLQGGSVRAWVRQICVHVASNHRRSQRRRREDAVAEPPEVSTPASQQGEVERRELQQQLLAALAALSEEQRAVFVLYEIEQLTMPEIATAIGCALQTAYSRLYAARTKVHSAMKGIDP
jgi:RNA polymerase sigma-70 factor (ECF subfamily)